MEQYRYSSDSYNYDYNIIVIREFPPNILRVRDNIIKVVLYIVQNYVPRQSDTGTSFLVARILTYCVTPKFT